jgi:hypothetical protein
MMHRRPFRRFPLVRARLLVAALLFALFALPFSGHRAEAAVPAAVLADLRSKAESGDSIAQYNLGVAYADAADPVSDASEAYAWLTLAGEQGANLEVLQTLIERLSPSQLAEGKRLLDSRRSELAQRAREASPFVGTAVNAAATGASAVVAAATDVVATPANPAPSGSGAAAKEAALGKIAELNQQISARDQRIAALEAELSDAKSKTGSRELQEQLAAKAQLLAASDASSESAAGRSRRWSPSMHAISFSRCVRHRLPASLSAGTGCSLRSSSAAVRKHGSRAERPPVVALDIVVPVGVVP